ncbi:MAG: peptidoglycan bridge formation glycyltransferase FemA/FemB family protein [Bacteroidales bacterium]|nr:peptidoglycan bridge formation glycyltransferase FemA/FemB family protein [Bacteroidales bacterium]
MQLCVIKEKPDKKLNNEIDHFLDGQAFKTVFQSPSFFGFYKDVAYYEPIYLLARDKEGHLIGVLLAVIIREGNGILGFFSRRCVVYGGPIVKDDDATVLNLLLSKLNKAVRRKALFTQFRNFREWPNEIEELFAENGYVLRDRLNSLVELQKTAAVAAQFSPSRRRQLKKAMKAGAEVAEAQSLQEVDALYALLTKLYTDKVKKPLPTKQFFHHFYKTVVAVGAGTILLVWHDKQLIGGIVAPITKGYSISELYVVGLDQAFPDLYPSIVATWAAMDYGRRNGLLYFDFMGLGKPDVAYGVRDFKLRFGGSRVNYGRFAKRNYKLLYGIAELGYNVWRMKW